MLDLFIDLVVLFLLYIYIFFFFPFSLSVSVYMYASLCDFLCKALLLPFVQGPCLTIFFFFVQFLVLVIIGGFLFWFGCSLLSFFSFFKLLFNFLIFNNF